MSDKHAFLLSTFWNLQIYRQGAAKKPITETAVWLDRNIVLN